MLFFIAILLLVVSCRRGVYRRTSEQPNDNCECYEECIGIDPNEECLGMIDLCLCPSDELEIIMPSINQKIEQMIPQVKRELTVFAEDELDAYYGTSDDGYGGYDDDAKRITASDFEKALEKANEDKDEEDDGGSDDYYYYDDDAKRITASDFEKALEKANEDKDEEDDGGTDDDYYYY